MSTFSPISSANCCKIFFCFSESFFGTSILTLTYWSPLPAPRKFLIPLFLSLKTVPVWVPSGTSYFTLPSIVGTSIEPPNVALANDTGISHHTSLPSRSNISWGFTLIYTYRSPAGPPRSPWFPSPLKGITEPVSTPAGIFIESFLDFCSLPVPLHDVHGSSTTSPVPLQVEHIFVLANCPKGVLWTVLMLPEPWQVGQVFLLVPFLAPVPSHTWHFSIRFILISFLVPNAASSKVISNFIFKSEPALGPVLWVLVLPPPKPPPKKSPNISPNISPKSLNPAPPPPNPWVWSNAAWPNWSYLAFLSGSDNISYASFTSLNFASASLLSGFKSGWYCFANFLNADFISFSSASLLIPRTS